MGFLDYPTSHGYEMTTKKSQNSQRPRRGTKISKRNAGRAKPRNTVTQVPKTTRTNTLRISVGGRPVSVAGASSQASNTRHASLRAYIRAVVDPFRSAPAGIPCFPMVPSLKMKVVQRGTFVTSTADGIGYVLVGPVCASGATLWVQNSAALAADGFANQVGITTTGHPYTTSDFGAYLKSRVVGCALRIKNATRSQDRGGMAYVIREPDGRALDAPLGVNTVAAVQRFATQGGWAPADTSGQWSQMNYVKTDPSDYDYYQSFSPAGTSLKCIGAYIVAPGVQQTYEYEQCILYEVIGSTSGGSGVLPGATEVEPHHMTPTADSVATKVLNAHVERQHSLGQRAADLVADGVNALRTGEEIVSKVGQVVESGAQLIKSFA